MRTLRKTDHCQGTMETYNTNNGLPSVLTGANVSQQSGDMWRPWIGTEDISSAHKAHSIHGDVSAEKHPKTPYFVHPVKLFWPKSKCFDYLFHDAEMLLRNYPVQATISFYGDSSSDEDSEEEEDEEMEKELN